MSRQRTSRPQGEMKTCASCGREMAWRAEWSAVWDEVKYCSAACRARKVTAKDRELEDAIVALLVSRTAKDTIGPADAARAVGGEDWRELRESARRAARRLVAAGVVEIVQDGRVVDPSTAKGDIRIRRRLPAG
ncbi:DUF3253 domain-containing protein [Microbacterium sp. UFMG61]|uniref:DUF3253 domain-containing protein n=1 Tax=Microbacterium sp. UFMG61 TaxID=2745935 RepID=UPI00188E796F|nr:DUF3253 domain-containing protein [Microbacterium sp. UFMG61]